MWVLLNAFWKTKYCSIPLLRMFATLSMSSTKYVGISCGTVMYHMVWNRPAPSTFADSYSAWSIPEIAARYKIAPHPRVFQIPQAAIVSQTWVSESRNFTGVEMIPELTSTLLTRPVLENIEKAIM